MTRPGRDGDAAAFIALIGRCWADYPGCVLDVDAEAPELRALATYYAELGGALWIAGDGVGMVATRPLADGAWEICRVYVHPDGHGGGMGGALLDLAEAHAIGQGARRLVLWTDTRFTRAHRFYEKRSYVRDGPVRALDDIARSLEYEYAKPVNGVRVLDVAAARGAERRLAEILVACVADGASVSFLRPLEPEAARRFWSGVSALVGEGRCLLLGAWCGGVLAGTVHVVFAGSELGRHRAEVAKLLVHPAFGRRGLGRALLAAAERAAAEAGRTLLTLDTRKGDGAERLYRAQGWVEAGQIPGFTLDAGGRRDGTVIFYKDASP